MCSHLILFYPDTLLQDKYQKLEVATNRFVFIKKFVLLDVSDCLRLNKK